MSTQLINDSLNPVCELAQTAFIAELAQNKDLFTASVLCFNSLSHLHRFSSGGEDYEQIMTYISVSFSLKAVI